MRDIARKLGLIGLRAVTSPEGFFPLHQFREDEIERLARDEHDRWCQERRSRGWTYGEIRDNRKKLHPNLLPWDDPRITEPVKEIDRNAIRRLPAILARADYQIVRIGPAPGPDEPGAFESREK